MNTNTTLSSGIIELARPELEEFGEEVGRGDCRRILVASRMLARDSAYVDGDWDSNEAAYELRANIAIDLGDELAGEDQVEGMHGIPAIEGYITLRRVYGANWAHLAYTDYLTYYRDDCSAEPSAVVSAVMAEIGERHAL